jgi:hypothetical protein
MSTLDRRQAIVEITQALPPRDQPKYEAPRSRSAPTAQEAFATLQTSEGAASMIEAVPSLAQPELWRELAYFDVRGFSGPTVAGLEFWNADLGGFSLQDSLDNDFIFFGGAYWEPPNGRVECYFNMPEPPSPVAPLQVGTDCAFHVRLYGYGLPAETEMPEVGFFLDDQALGERQFQDWTDTTLHARLVPGFHRLEIRQMPGSGSILFQSASIWQALVVAPPGPAES